MCVCVTVSVPVFSTGDVEFDIESLYKAVPQLAKVFRIIDKIGEGQYCMDKYYVFTFYLTKINFSSCSCHLRKCCLVHWVMCSWFLYL